MRSYLLMAALLLLMAGGESRSVAAESSALREAATLFALGSYDAAEEAVRSFLAGNPTAAELDRAIELLTEIRIEKESSRIDSGVPAKLSVGKTAITPELISGPARQVISAWNRSFPGSPDQYKKDATVYAITAEGRGDITTLKIHRSGSVDFAMQRQGLLLLVDLPGLIDGLPSGGMELPGGGASSIRHSQHTEEPLVTRIAIQLRTAKVKADVSAGDDAVVIVVEDEASSPSQTTAGTYRPPVATSDYRIDIVGGNFQSAPAADRLAEPLTVRVVDPKSGTPRADVPVQFYSVDPGVTFSDPASRSNLQGIAMTNAVLDQSAGRKVIYARVPETKAEVGFEVYAVPRSPDSIRKVAMTEIKVRTRQASSTPLVVSVQDIYGNPVAGVPVKWKYVSGDGRLDVDPSIQGDQSIAETNEKGMATLRSWTTGPLPGLQRIQAQFSSGAVSRFTQFDLDVEPQLVSVDFFQTPVPDILRFLGRVANWNLIISDGVLALPPEASDITVHLENTPIDEALDKILQMKNLTRVDQSDGSIKIVTFIEAQTAGQQIITDASALDRLPQDAVKTVILEVPTEDFEGIVTALAPLMTAEGRVARDKNSRKIVVTDYVSVIRRMRDILDEFASGSGWRILTFQNLTLSTKTMEELIKTQIPPEMKTFFNGKTGIFIGPDPAIDRVESLLRAMDENEELLAASDEGGGKTYEIIPLRQQKATELQGILQQVFTSVQAREFLSGLSIKESKTTKVESGEDNKGKSETKDDQLLVERAFGQTVDEVRIVAEPKTNALILFGLPSDLAIVKQVIQRLDAIDLQKEILTKDQVRFIFVKYRQVTEVSRVLNEILFPENRAAERDDARTNRRYWWDYWYDGMSGGSSSQVSSIQGQMRAEEDTVEIPLRMIVVPEPNLLIVIGGKPQEHDLIEQIVTDLDEAVIRENNEYLQVYSLQYLLPSEFEKFMTETKLNEERGMDDNWWIDCYWFGRNCSRSNEGELSSFAIDALSLIVVRATRIKHNQVNELLKIVDNSKYERRLDLLVKHYTVENGNIDAISEILTRNALNQAGTSDEFLFIDRETRKIVVWAREGTQIRIERLLPQFDQVELKFDPALKYEIYEFRNITVTEVIGVTTEAERSVVEISAGFGQSATRAQNKTILQLISEPLGGDEIGGRGVYPSVTGNFILVWGPTGAVDRAIGFARQIDDRWDKARISLEIYEIEHADPQTFMNFVKGTIFGEDNRTSRGAQVQTQATEFLIPSKEDPRILFVWALPATHDRIKTFQPIMDTTTFSFTNHKVFRVPGLRFGQARELANAVSPGITLFDIGDLWLSIGDIGALQRLEEVMSAVTPALDTEVPQYEIIRLKNRLAMDVERALVELMGLGTEGSAGLAALSFGGARASVPLAMYPMSDANSIIFTGGSKEQRLLAITLAKELDEQPYARDQFIRIYDLTYILPSEFDAFLQQTIVDERLERITTGTASAEEGRTTVTQTITNAKRIALDSLKIMLIRTTREIHQQIADLLDLVDKEDFGDKLELRSKVYKIEHANLDAIANVLARAALNQHSGVADEFYLIDRENRQLIIWAREGSLTKIERILPTFDKPELSYDPGLRYAVYTFQNISVALLQNSSVSGLVSTGQSVQDIILELMGTGAGDRGSYLSVQGNFVMIWGPTNVVDIAVKYCKELDQAWSQVHNAQYELIPVKYKRPSELRDDIARLWAGHGYEIIAMDERGAILVVTPPDILDRIRQLVADFDTRVPTAVYTPTHAVVGEIARSLQNLYGVQGGERGLTIEEFNVPGSRGTSMLRLRGPQSLIDRALELAREIDSEIDFVLYHGIVQHPNGDLNTLVMNVFPQLSAMPINSIRSGEEWMVIKGPKHLLKEALKLCDTLDTRGYYEVFEPRYLRIGDITTAITRLYPHMDFFTVGPGKLFVQGRRDGVKDAMNVLAEMDTDMPHRWYRSSYHHNTPTFLTFLSEMYPNAGVFSTTGAGSQEGVIVRAPLRTLDEISAFWDDIDTVGEKVIYRPLNRPTRDLEAALHEYMTHLGIIVVQSGGRADDMMVLYGDKIRLREAVAFLKELDTKHPFRVFQLAYLNDVSTLLDAMFPNIEYVTIAPVSNVGLSQVVVRAPWATLEAVSAVWDKIDTAASTVIYRAKYRTTSDIRDMVNNYLVPAVTLVVPAATTSLGTVSDMLVLYGEQKHLDAALKFIAKIDVADDVRVLQYGRLNVTDATTLVQSFYPNIALEVIATSSIILARGAPEQVNAAEKMLAQLEEDLHWRIWPLTRISPSLAITTINNLFGSVQAAELPVNNGLALIAGEARMAEVIAFLRKLESNAIHMVPVTASDPTTVLAAVRSFYPGVEGLNGENTPGVINNNVVFTADQSVADEIREFVRRIDKRIHTAIRPLRHFDPTVAGELSSLQTTLQNYLTAAGSIFFDNQSNAFVMTAPLDNLEDALRVLDDLDRPAPQFLIEVVIAEVNQSDIKQLGISWQLRPDLTDFGLPPSFPVGTPSGGAADVQFSNAGDFSVGIGRNNFAATLSALLQTTDARVVSSPKIITRNNVEGSISVNQNLPYTVTSLDANGNPATTTEFQAIPITLTVTPTSIDGSDNVRMTVDATIEVLASPAVAGQAAATNQRTVTTTVEMKDGGTIIIGGLMSTNENEVLSKVPILGDIPGIGQLFRNRTVNLTNTEVLIFLTPRLLYKEAYELQMEEELNRFKYLVNFPADWSGRRWLINNPREGEKQREKKRNEPSNFIIRAETMKSAPTPSEEMTMVPGSARTPSADASAKLPQASILGVMSSIDLNTATAAQLKSLPGMPAHVAELIVRYRSTNGAFRRVRDIINVPGVTVDIIDQVGPYLRVTTDAMPVSAMVKTVPAAAPKATPSTPALEAEPPVVITTSTSPTAAAKAPKWPTEKININTASIADFGRIPGLGENTARMIIAYRNTYGAFSVIDELVDVPGITPDFFAKIRNVITVSSVPVPVAAPAVPVEPAPTPATPTMPATPKAMPPAMEAAAVETSEPASAMYTGKVNINTAGLGELMGLPGVDEGKARMIMAYRNSYGAFQLVDELLDVPSMTPEVYGGIRDMITVDEVSSSSAPASTAAPAPEAEWTPPPAAVPAPSAPQSGGLVNINTATESELSAISEFSPQNVKLILAYRASYGTFSTVDDLMQVPSINKTLLDKVRGRLTAQ